MAADGHRDAGKHVADDLTRGKRVWTVPNLISMARLAGVPVFLWLVLVPRPTGGHSAC